VQVLSTSQDGSFASLSITAPSGVVGTFALVATNPAGNSGTTPNRVNRLTIVDPNSTADTDADGFQDVIEAVYGTDPLDPTSYPTYRSLGVSEVESVAYSILNAPVTMAGVTEAESLPFSTLNAPVTMAGVTETESVPFSILNAPVTAAGVTELESAPFSLLNAPVTTAGIAEVESSPFSVLNTATGSALTPATDKSNTVNDSSATLGPSSAPTIAIDPLVDSDGDGLPDWFELLIGTDPQNADTDADGLTDYDEIFIYHTNPLNADTDGDGFSDSEEVLFGADPLNPADTPLHPRTVVARNRHKVQAVQGDKNGRQNSQKPTSTKTISGAIGSRSTVRRTGSLD
jgi:hypothetical protein